MHSGAQSRRVRICMEGPKIKARSLNSLGLELVKVQEKTRMITSYLAGVIMLQFVPFGEKNISESFFELDSWLWFVGPQLWKARQANDKSVFLPLTLTLWPSKKEVYQCHRKLILIYTHFPAEIICWICVITNTLVLVHYICRGNFHYDTSQSWFTEDS